MANNLAFIEMTEEEFAAYENNQRTRGDAQPKVLEHLNNVTGPNTLVVDVEANEDDEDKKELKSIFGKYSRACTKFAADAKKMNMRLSAICDFDNNRVLVGRYSTLPVHGPEAAE